MSDCCTSTLLRKGTCNSRAAETVDHKIYIVAVCADQDEAYLLPRYCLAMIPMLGFIVLVLVCKKADLISDDVR